MNCNPNFKSNRCLIIGLCLNIIYMCSAHSMENQAPLVLNLLNFIEGLAVVLMLLGLLHATPKGRALLDQVCRWKRGLFGKGAA